MNDECGMSVSVSVSVGVGVGVLTAEAQRRGGNAKIKRILRRLVPF
jgi:hypothetical protein